MQKNQYFMNNYAKIFRHIMQIICRLIYGKKHPDHSGCFC